VTELDESKVPSFLVRDVSANSSDQKALLFKLQRLALWQYVNGDKPFNDVAAVDLQRRLSLAYQERLRVESAERKRVRIQEEVDYADLCRLIVEEVFSVEYEREDFGVKPIGWHDKIVDEITKKSVGTPSQLFNKEADGAVAMAWHAVNANAETDLINFLSQLRRKYDGFDYYFSFDRERLKPSSFLRDAAGVVLQLIRGVEPETPKYFGFRLHLTWKPSNEAEVAKKLETIIDSHGRIAVQHQQMQ
jgi:hypothetical protein